MGSLAFATQKLTVCLTEKKMVQVLLKVVRSKKVLEAVGYESISSNTLDLSWPVVILRSGWTCSSKGEGAGGFSLKMPCTAAALCSDDAELHKVNGSIAMPMH